MEFFCDKHPASVASGTCHSCGKHFCKDCLVQGTEYFYCTDAVCQDQMIRDEASVPERNRRLEEQLEQAVRAFNGKVSRILVVVWILVTPLFIWLGSDGWTNNRLLASVMGSLGSLVLCLQLRPIMGLYWPRYLARRNPELVGK